MLDCGGELAGKVVPRLGTIELTQTGERNYRHLEQSLSFPVISVDSSRLKRIEDRLGSADGLKRALDLLCGEQVIAWFILVGACLPDL